MGMMLLGRKVGETICIGSDVTVKVVEAQKGKVKLAILAPPHIAVDREEVRERKLREAMQAPA